MDKTLFADTARFPHETIDGETVLVDSELGHLFLFTGLGPWLWQRMALGGTVEKVVGEMIAKFGAERGSHAPFSRDARRGGLLRSPATGPDLAEDTGMPCPDAFATPAIERYEDIADIIAMDPVHDIDTTKGWPHRKADSE